MLIKPINNVALALLLIATSVVLAQTDGLTNNVQEKLAYYTHHPCSDKDLDDMKVLFGGYDKTRMARELLSAYKAEAGSISHPSFDDKIQRIYSALRLPPKGITDALDEEESPHMKLRLMRLFGRATDPDVIACLLRQIHDKRLALEATGDTNGDPVEGLRVCDIACDHLAQNLTGSLDVVTVTTPMIQRDAIIASTLQELKLNAK